MALEGLTTIQFFPQIEYFSRLAWIILKLIKVNSCNLVLKIKVTFFSLVKAPKYKYLILNEKRWAAPARHRLKTFSHINLKKAYFINPTWQIVIFAANKYPVLNAFVVSSIK